MAERGVKQDGVLKYCKEKEQQSTQSNSIRRFPGRAFKDYHFADVF